MGRVESESSDPDAGTVPTLRPIRNQYFLESGSCHLLSGCDEILGAPNIVSKTIFFIYAELIFFLVSPSGSSGSGGITLVILADTQ